MYRRGDETLPLGQFIESGEFAFQPTLCYAGMVGSDR
jgi:hypothetical protein